MESITTWSPRFTVSLASDGSGSPGVDVVEALPGRSATDRESSSKGDASRSQGVMVIVARNAAPASPDPSASLNGVATMT